MFRSLILGPSGVHFCEPGGDDRGVSIHLLPKVREKPSRQIQRRVETFTRDLRGQCRLSRVTLLSRFDYCREMRVTPLPTEQGSYPPRASREIDARLCQ